MGWLGPCPMVEESGSAVVDHALSGYGDAARLLGEDERLARNRGWHGVRVSVDLVERQDVVVVLRLRAAEDHGALLQMQLHAALQVERAAGMDAFPDDHASAAICRRRVDLRLDGRRLPLHPLRRPRKNHARKGKRNCHDANSFHFHVPFSYEASIRHSLR